MEEFDELEHKVDCNFYGDIVFECRCCEHKIKSFISSSHERLLDEVIGIVNKEKRFTLFVNGVTTIEFQEGMNKGFNSAIVHILSILQALKDEIK